MEYVIITHMNKNTMQRQKEIRKQPFVTGGFKKKAKPFPRVGQPLSMIDQIKMFQGPCCLLVG